MTKSSFVYFFKNHYLNLFIVCFSLIYFLVTSYDSIYDVINPDSINWHARSYFFSKALKSQDYSQTYQAYHPGITLMWLMSQTLYSDGNFYTKDNFLEKDYWAKQVIYLVLTLNFLITLFLLKNFLKPPSLILFSFLYTLEPFILGVRRLVHLEALMTSFLFISFLALLTYSLKKTHYLYLILSTLFFILAIYTKSSAIILGPILFIIYFLGNSSFKLKLSYLPLIFFSAILFLYLFFPALWKKPFDNSILFINKIYEGATLVGYEGRLEVGTSGQGSNRILKKSFSKINNFYYDSMLYTLSQQLWVLIVSTIPFIIFFIYTSLRSNKGNSVINLAKNFLFSQEFKIFILTFLGFIIFFLVYSQSVKSYERYSYVFFPFLIFLISQIYNLIDAKFTLIATLIYFAITLKDLREIHPYYYIYGNSYFGGSFARYEKLNSPPFGVGVYELNRQLSDYIKFNETEYYPVIAGSKSLKAIFNSGRNERYPLCDVDYFIRFYDDKGPAEVCVGRSVKHIFSIKIGNIEYWKVYKFDRRSSKAKKLNGNNKEQNNLPEIDSDNN
jgi:hypothetical protein